MTLYERLMPQAREILDNRKDRWPNVVESIEAHLKDERYSSWTQLPYIIVRYLNDRIFGSDPLGMIDEGEIRMLFKDYYE